VKQLPFTSQNSVDVKVGIHKWQWLFVFLVLSLPLLLNSAAIWLSIGTAGTLQLLMGSYQPTNPNLPLASLPNILLNFIVEITVLGFLSWLVIFVSNRTFFQKQWLIAKILESLLAVLLVAKVFEMMAGFIMPLAWLPEFYDQVGGLPASNFATNWSRWFVFPSTAIILFLVINLSPESTQVTSS
jgi:hypothetical protein